MEQYDRAIQYGTQSFLEPTTYNVSGQNIIQATVSAFGHTTHTFIQRESQHSSVLPFFEPLTPLPLVKPGFFSDVDHVSICLLEGDLLQWVDYYQKIYGFYLSHEEKVATAYSGMNSKVVQSENGQIKIVLVEPVAGKKSSQVAEYLKFGGAGVQHIAFSTANILATTQVLKNAGLEMLSIPSEYYEMQKNKCIDSHFSLNDLREHSILIDKNETGFLYQAFSKSVDTKPTLFFEVIQREGCNGFGSANIKALFQAVEQEQFKREGD